MHPVSKIDNVDESGPVKGMKKCNASLDELWLKKDRKSMF